MEEQPICRICFCGEEDGQSLVSPCKCQGSQRYVHLSCLRKWQRSVQLDRSNHPDDTDHEDRHRICNVCKEPFDILPEDRATMMSGLAEINPEEIRPGMVLITKQTAAEEALPAGSQLNLLLRAYIEAKAAHFREAVYILTKIRSQEASDGSDAVIGVNLTRTMDTPDASMLEAAPDEATMEMYEGRGVRIRWMNGGPVSPRAVSAMLRLSHLSRGRRTELCAKHGLEELASDEGVVIQGSMLGVLMLAAEEADAAAAGGHERAATVLAWAGYAQWSRTQLLGEIARGSWGWCQGTAADVRIATEQLSSGSTSLWSSMRYSQERVHWAPENEFSREFERHFQRPVVDPAAAPLEPDPREEALGTLVQIFESRRRGNEPTARHREAVGNTRSLRRVGRTCTQQ